VPAMVIEPGTGEPSHTTTEPIPADLAAAIDHVLAAVEPRWTEADARALRDLGVIERSEQCVAATGHLADPEQLCTCHVDGVHRCHRAPNHQHLTEQQHVRVAGRHRADHVCACGYVWVCARGGMEVLEDKWQEATSHGSARALVRVLLHMRASQAPHYGLMAAVVRDVARDLKIDLEDDHG
jgi:hypothetical protein